MLCVLQTVKLLVTNWWFVLFSYIHKIDLTCLNVMCRLDYTDLSKMSSSVMMSWGWLWLLWLGFNKTVETQNIEQEECLRDGLSLNSCRHSLVYNMHLIERRLTIKYCHISSLCLFFFLYVSIHLPSQQRSEVISHVYFCARLNAWIWFQWERNLLLLTFEYKRWMENSISCIWTVFSTCECWHLQNMQVLLSQCSCSLVPREIYSPLFLHWK